MLKTAESVSPPRLRELGADLLRLSKWQLARCLALPFMAFAAFWICAAFELWTLAVSSTVILSFVTYGSTSHDLVHKSLGLKRLTNDLLLAIIEAISLRSGHAYQAVHLNHHARFLHDDDIEAQASRMSWTRALLEGVVFQFRTYRWALRHARRAELDHRRGNRCACGRHRGYRGVALDSHSRDLCRTDDRRQLGHSTGHVVPAARRSGARPIASDATLSRSLCPSRGAGSSLSPGASHVPGRPASELATTGAAVGSLAQGSGCRALPDRILSLK